MSFDPVDLLEKLTQKRLANSKTRSIATNIEKVWKFVYTKMVQSQEKYTEAADRNQKSVEYKMGNNV